MSAPSWKDRFARQAQFVLDLATLTIAFVLAYLLRFDFRIPSEYRLHLWTQLPYVVLIQFVMLFLTGIYTFVWRFVGLAEVAAFVRAAAFSALPLLALRLGLPEPTRSWKIPLSIILMDTLLAFGGLLALRVGRRMIYEQERRRRRETRESVDLRRVLLIGAGQAGIVVAREIQRQGGMRLQVVGFVDDESFKQGTVIQGLKVLGTTRDLPRLVVEHRIDHVILTLVDVSRRDMRRVTEICEGIPIPVRVVPGLDEVLEGRVRLERTRAVEIEDLLGREPIELDQAELNRFLSGRRVLVTGAGGSIGAELAQQVMRFAPERLVLLDRSEYALFEIERSMARRWPSSAVRAVLADVHDDSAIRRVLSEHDPDVLLHAAAHKHVPMMEYHPAEAIRNNSLATARLAVAAGELGVRTFVLISTDKAVHPTSIMGASKRVAEIAVQDAGRRFPESRFLAVRFGNVLGSTGSVIPLFREQIEGGGPIEVTHPGMTRYFMTASEAAQLVLQAAAIGSSGEIMVLDMGEPVPIADLARDMIRLSGLKPYEDIDIVYTRPRPGEKLFEELGLDGERNAKTRHPKIFVGRLESYSGDRVDFALRRLAELVESDHPDSIRAFLSELLPESRLAARTPEPEGAPGDAAARRTEA
jgi:FlaA1/EpsC-like NDP-sugar epimerase